MSWSARPRRQYPAALEAVLTATVADGRDAGRRVLREQELEYPPVAIPPRRMPSRKLRIATFRRDNFHCRYCETPVVLTQVMQLMSFLYGDVFPFTPNWKGGLTHPAVIACSPIIDHVEPLAWDMLGRWNDPDNLVTACNPCNAAKSDLTLEELKWTKKPIVHSEWDGLARFYRPLWEEVRPMIGDPRDVRYHDGWLKDLGC